NLLTGSFLLAFTSTEHPGTQLGYVALDLHLAKFFALLALRMRSLRYLLQEIQPLHSRVGEP
ncbi:hypothetical protein MGG_16046, partial [Pyricularia oryzae 70-15]